MAYRLIGKDFIPQDVEAKVRGTAKFAEDYKVDGMVFAKLLTSPHAHALIKNIDTTEAMRMPGVVGILTSADVPAFPPPQAPILAKDEVFYVGEPILAIAAVDELTAANALEKVKIDFEPLPHATDPLESLFPGGPNARSTGNVAASQINLQTIKWDAADFAAAGEDKLPLGKPAEEWKYGDIDAGFRASKVIVEESFITGASSNHSMETRSALAYWDNGKLFLYGSSQSHTNAVPNVARLCGVDPTNLIFIAEYCGGGFGSKAAGYPIMSVPAHLSKKINRPVMMRINRFEEYAFGITRPGFQGRVKVGFGADGRLLAADLYLVAANGPVGSAGDFRAAGNCMSLLYQPESMRYRAISVLTNTPLTGPQRGPGENQFVGAFEPVLDRAAAQLGIDRLAIRRINAPDSAGKIGADRGPLTSAYQKDALDMLAQKFNWDEKKRRSGQRVGNKIIGVGLGQGYHSAGGSGFDGLVRITPDGKLHVHNGTGNLGTYSHAATSRVAAEMLNYDWNNVIVERGDTRRGLPFNSIQAGSNSASSQARTNYVAALDAKAKLLEIAAQMLGGAAGDYELAETGEKVVRKGDATKSITYAQAAQKAVELGGKYSGRTFPDDLNPITKDSMKYVAGTGLVGVAKDTLARVGVVPGLSASVAVVEVDAETGQFKLLELAGVGECGTVLHPQGLAAQGRSGQIMGVGEGLFEHHVYDPKLGIPAAASLERSRLPSYLDVPAEIGWAALDKADPQNPVGVRGIGEPVMGSACAAVVCAINDALGGKLPNRTPVSLDVVLNVLTGRPQSVKALQPNV